MFQNATVSSRSSSSRSGGTTTCPRNASMPSLPSLPSLPSFQLHQRASMMAPSGAFNPIFRPSDNLTSFDASQFVFSDHQKHHKRPSHRRHALLRRFNSHDSHNAANINVNFMNLNSSSGATSNFNDFPTDGVEGDENFESVGSKRSVEKSSDENLGGNKKDEYEAKDFLERFSLPRVVRVENGEPLLLYRCIDSFTKVQAKGFVGKKGKEKLDGSELFFPEGYCGWFSLTNEKGEKSAVSYSSILQLVREQVCSFLSLQPFTAYAGHNTDQTAEIPGKIQYLKTQVKAGQLFQLRAVFQHKERFENGRHSTKSSHISRSVRDKDLANRYAQLISQNNQEFYVPLTTKGEFYETHSSMKARLCFQGFLEKTGPLALDKDCLYKITHLLRRIALPIKVKLLSGTLPEGLPKDFSDTFILEKKIQEPLMVTCTLPSPTETNQTHQISCINLNSRLKLTRSLLGFESENRLFKSQRLQTALSFCHKNVENWYREVRIAPNLLPIELNTNNSSKINNGDHIEKPSFSGKKYDEENEIGNQKKQLITKEAMEKFPKSKKWYKNLKKFGIKSDNFEKLDKLDKFDVEMEKLKSIERYKDMSRLIEERFGKKSYNPVKKSASFMFSNKLNENFDENPKKSPTLLKCQSLDTQIYNFNDEKHKKLDFQLNLKNEKSKIDFDEIKIVQDEDFNPKPIKKSKPDLIPTLPKNPEENSFITDRLCSEFYVKTKIQKQKPTKSTENLKPSNSNVKSIVVDVHDENPHKKGLKKTKIIDDDIPYSRVLDEIKDRNVEKKIDENIYAEICENANELCDKKEICECKRRKNCININKSDVKTGNSNKSEYCYVKLGSNGDSVTQSDSDEAIYNTLR